MKARYLTAWPFLLGLVLAVAFTALWLICPYIEAWESKGNIFPTLQWLATLAWGIVLGSLAMGSARQPGSKQEPRDKQAQRDKPLDFHDSPPGLTEREKVEYTIVEALTALKLDSSQRRTLLVESIAKLIEEQLRKEEEGK